MEAFQEASMELFQEASLVSAHMEAFMSLMEYK
jgi:hypothetical protein